VSRKSKLHIDPGGPYRQHPDCTCVMHGYVENDTIYFTALTPGSGCSHHTPGAVKSLEAHARRNPKTVRVPPADVPSHKIGGV
jgi:hypothetical protein